jgi:hypothetical protein
MSTKLPPPPDHVQQAAKVVQDWLDAEQGKTAVPAAKPLSDAEKLDRCRQHDQSKMPPWRDPRLPPA